MTTTYTLDNDGRWASLCDDSDTTTPLRDSAERALALAWGQGDDLDEQLDSLGGGITLDLTSETDRELIASARSADGLHRATVRVVRF